ncbi:MgtC/SapB family protein [Gluconobacter sphaericus]|uniref:MgtC/SapB family protein n=1 Tax=Gluconobacter sphaericus TaxID=574987 RepID=UPI00312BA2D7
MPAFVLSSLVGLEREIRQKSGPANAYAYRGFRALLMLISKYGFMEVIDTGRIVSGSGVIGGDVIFHAPRCRARPYNDCDHLVLRRLWEWPVMQDYPFSPLPRKPQVASDHSGELHGIALCH